MAHFAQAFFGCFLNFLHKLGFQIAMYSASLVTNWVIG